MLAKRGSDENSRVGAAWPLPLRNHHFSRKSKIAFQRSLAEPWPRPAPAPALAPAPRLPSRSITTRFCSLSGDVCEAGER
jgi:hypothetical protein